VDVLSGNLRYQPRAFQQARAKDRMLQIRNRFFKGADRVEVRRRTVAESLKLRKDEPHPVAALAAFAQFTYHLRVDGAMGIEKSLKLVWIVQAS